MSAWTAAEAATKWCPAAAAATSTKQHCLGDGCMAWRWWSIGVPGPVYRDDEKQERLGYCGLAVKPADVGDPP